MHLNDKGHLIAGTGNFTGKKDRRTFKSRIAKARAEVKDLESQGIEFVQGKDGVWGWKKKGENTNG